MKIREIEAKNYREERDRIARIEIETEGKTYYSLEHYGQEHGLNPTVISRILREYKETVGNYEGITALHLAKGSRTLWIRGTKYRSISAYLRDLNLTEHDRRIRHHIARVGSDYKNLLTLSQQVQLGVDRFYYDDKYAMRKAPQRRYLDTKLNLRPLKA